ncbi:GAF and ANTAR domain-containing protein [Gordonia rubripertincta]|uniref:GAF and ANTAR domain-containing protein n=1 Tax=Gordonia rubripertincta TaxID=36822 RepID=A0ABT4N477_GORRU|nr:GAF and ANTAR domain-containing protein [Gordonia rubripertincta]MCZ4553121.1 GAF and ANTAR domain-containing protein [Gordonia rubripertincta]
MSEQGDTHVFKVLADHARSMHAKTRLGSDALLAEITGSAVQLIDGAVSAGITVTKKRKVVDTLAPTDDDAREFDLIQQQAGQGPCLDAAWQHRTVRVPNLLNDGRWPALAAEIRDRSPIRASVSYELFTHTEGMGALNVYATKAHAITDSEVEKGYALAAHAALVFDAARKYDQFQSALASRDIIGQAKGMIMERFNIGADAAFELLTKLSQDSNVTVAEISRQLAGSKPETE